MDQENAWGNGWWRPNAFKEDLIVDIYVFEYAAYVWNVTQYVFDEVMIPNLI